MFHQYIGEYKSRKIYLKMFVSWLKLNCGFDKVKN